MFSRLALCAFLFVPWIGGLFSPFFLVFLYLNGWILTATSILGFLIYCYLGPSPSETNRQRLIDFVNFAGPRAFKEVSFFMEEKPDLQKLESGQERLLVAYHPHGMFCWGFFLHGGYCSPKLSFFPIQNLFVIAGLHPFYEGATRGKIILQVTNAPCHRQHQSDVQPPDHWAGSARRCPLPAAGTDRVYLKKRQGFIKYALQYGYNLMPVYTFGEADTYLNHDGGYDWKFKLNDKSIPTIVPFGEWWCPLLPRYNTRLHSVAGRFVKSAS